MRDLAADVAMKQHDSAPPIMATAIVAATEVPKDLSAATASFKLMRVTDGTHVTLAGTTVVVPGVVQNNLIYTWNAADTAIVGDYAGEFQVTYSDGSIETFPPDRQISVRILADAG